MEALFRKKTCFVKKTITPVHPIANLCKEAYSWALLVKPIMAMSYSTSSLPQTARINLIGLLVLLGLSSGSAAFAQSNPLSFGRDRLPAGTLDALNQNLPLSVNPTALGRYVVYVNGNSNLLLDQVRRIEPGAFLRNDGGQQVIQAGRFVSPANAQGLINLLERQGILAEVQSVDDSSDPTGIGGETSNFSTATTTIPLDTTSITTPTNLDFAAPIASTASIPFATNGISFVAPSPNRLYYVAIPSQPGNLVNLASEIAALGVNPANILPKSSPRGAFIAVGPFSDRLEATVMESTLKGSGFRNARVYFGY